MGFTDEQIVFPDYDSEIMVRPVASDEEIL